MAINLKDKINELASNRGLRDRFDFLRKLKTAFPYSLEAAYITELQKEYKSYAL